MASPGAGKGAAKKGKGTTLPLNNFLKPTTSSMSWADDDPDAEPPAPPPLPTAPSGASRLPPADLPARPAPPPGPPAPDLARLPTRPPYKIFVGNLPYDVHEQDLGDYFHQLHPVRDVLILRHRDTGNVKGAFVEFEGVEGVQAALPHDGRIFGGRPLRVDVASDRPERGGGGGFGRRGYEDDRRGGGGGFSDRYEERGPRGGGGGGFSDRGPPGYGDDFHERRDRRHRDWGAPEGEADAAARWGSRALPPPPPPQGAAEPPGPPVERKRLVLAPRSKPVGGDPPAAAAGAGAAADEADKPKKANPFGDAKPVDAQARLRELEEKAAKRKEEQRRVERERKEAAAAAAAAADEPPPGIGPEAAAAAAPAEASGSGRGPPPPPPPPPQEHGNGRQGPPAGAGQEVGGRGERGRGRRGGGRMGGRGGRFEEGPGGRGGRGGGRFDDGGYGGRGPRGRGGPPPLHAGGRGPARGGGGGEAGFQEAGGPRPRGGRTRGWEAHTPAQAARQPEHAQAEAGGGEAEPPASKVANMFEMLGTDE